MGCSPGKGLRCGHLRPPDSFLGAGGEEGGGGGVVIARREVFRHSLRDEEDGGLRQLSVENGGRDRVVIHYFERDCESAVALKRFITCEDRLQEEPQRKKFQPSKHLFS